MVASADCTAPSVRPNQSIFIFLTTIVLARAIFFAVLLIFGRGQGAWRETASRQRQGAKRSMGTIEVSQQQPPQMSYYYVVIRWKITVITRPDLSMLCGSHLFCALSVTFREVLPAPSRKSPDKGFDGCLDVPLAKLVSWAN